MTRRLMLVLAAVVICAPAGCGNRADGDRVSEASPASKELPKVGSEAWLALVEENERKDEAQFTKNRVKPGGTVAGENVKLTPLSVAWNDDTLDIAVKVENTSSNRVVSGSCFVREAKDEHGNHAEAIYLHSMKGVSLEQIKESTKEIQPAESKIAHIFIRPKLRSAKKITARISTDQGDDTNSVLWTLEFDIPD